MTATAARVRMRFKWFLLSLRIDVIVSVARPGTAMG
jgi:hypothetical protein